MGIRSTLSAAALRCAPLPQIAGMPARCLQSRLLAFGAGLRPGALMRHVARDLSETQSPRWARSCANTRRRTREIAPALGAADVSHDDGFPPNNHFMDVAIIGDDPRDSVVDGDSRVHGTQTLCVAFSSVFPSGACVNATLSIGALALRIGEEVGRRARG